MQRLLSSAASDISFPGEMLATVELCKTTKQKPHGAIKAALFKALLRSSGGGEEAIKEIMAIFMETAPNFSKLICVIVQA